MNTALKQIPEPDPDSIYATYDAQVISADFLIHHIDAAFLTRNYPWTDSVSFEDFCEYVLPYRVEFEPFENWMEIYAQNLQRYTDSLNGINANDSMVCAFFNQNLLHPETDYSIAYQTIFDLYPSKLFDMMTTWSIGRCKELTEFSHYVLRSVGLPIRWDATPNWGNRFNGHSWSTIKMNGKLYPFQLKDPQVEIGKHIRRDVNKISKVYRHMYSIQNESLCMRDIKEKIPPFFLEYIRRINDTIWLRHWRILFNFRDLTMGKLPPCVTKPTTSVVCCIFPLRSVTIRLYKMIFPTFSIMEIASILFGHDLIKQQTIMKKSL